MTVKVAIEYADGSYSEDDLPLGILAKYDRLVQQGLDGRALVDKLITDDWASPPVRVVMTFFGDGGTRTVQVM
jgi:hypothetical protein